MMTRAAIPSSALAIVVAFAMLFLSHIEHRKTFRPSSLLCTYLFVALVLDIPQARTLLMSNPTHATSILFPTAMALKIVILVLESQSKMGMLTSFDRIWSPEETTNVFSRRVFWWLNTLFRRGYRKTLAMADLFAIDRGITGHRLGSRLQSVWDCRRTRLQPSLSCYFSDLT